MITKNDREFGVHSTHCCSKHGCKYMQDDVCPVVNGLHEGVECESCAWEVEYITEAIELLKVRGWIPAEFDPAKHELINVPKENNHDTQ